jgi:hypothetical protein
VRPKRMNPTAPSVTATTDVDARRRLPKPGTRRIGRFIPCYVDVLFPEVGPDDMVHPLR